MADTFETTLLPSSLLPGDEVVSCGLSGHTGTVRAIRDYEDYVAVDFEDHSAALGPFEVVTVKRRPLATVHPIIADVLSAHGFGR